MKIRLIDYNKNPVTELEKDIECISDVIRFRHKYYVIWEYSYSVENKYNYVFREASVLWITTDNHPDRNKKVE